MKIYKLGYKPKTKRGNMNIENGQGKNKLELKAKNRKIIKEWFETIGGTMAECHRSTGLSYETIRSHVAEMRVEGCE